MTCFHPVRAYYPLETTKDGKRYLKFGRARAQMNFLHGFHSFMMSDVVINNNSSIPYSDLFDSPYDFPVYFDSNLEPVGLNITVPCGKCIGCRLDYSRMWATRSVHEAYMHNYYKNCAFLTLTFNDDMLYRRRKPHSLDKTAFRSWIKRLRKAVKAHYDCEFRFMACGEYGAKHHRPHYHILIYGFNFPDKYIYKYRKVNGVDVIYYRSDFLEKLWRPAHSDKSFGFSIIGDVNFESSAYVARYVTKKLFGKVAEKVYKDKEPEFLLTSRMPGLGFEYMKKFKDDIFRLGYVMLPNGFKAPIPRYYVNKIKEVDENLYSNYRMKSFDNFVNNIFVKNIDSTQERLMCREELKKLNLERLVREYEFSSNAQNEF